MSGSWAHQTVLLADAVEQLVTRADGVYLDGTFGRGGHARAILDKLSPHGRLVALDRDPEALAAAAAIDDARFSIHHHNFGALAELLDALQLARVDGVLLDIGVSSPQIDNPARGFSFRHDAPLDMRMDTSRGATAADFLATASVSQLGEVLRDYGEERFAAPIAKAVVARRERGDPVRTTGQLSELVARAVKTREPGQNPATRTFQALRIHVNAELAELEQGLAGAVERLAPGGRLVVIAFHSLEDRIVKTFIARESRAAFDRRAPVAPPPPLRLRSIARIKPGDDEVRANPRARSAVLRVAERTAELQQ